MSKLPLFGAVFTILAITGANLLGVNQAVAADLDSYEEHDRSYIDRTLDEFEQRTGQYRAKQYEQEAYPENDYKKQLVENDDYEAHTRHKFKKHGDNDNWRESCLPIRKIHRHLIKRGWHDFHRLNEGQNRVRILATNYNGRRFKLVVDKCSGEIIRRMPMRRYWAWDR